MARRYSWLVIVALMVLGVFVVLRVLRGGGGVPPAGQGTPQALLQKAQRALAEGDKARFLECLAVHSSDSRAAGEALFGYVQAAQALRDALRKHYGKNAWDTFVSLQAAPAQFAAFVWPRDDEVAATAQITVQGNEARVQLSPDAEPLMLRLEGVWRMDVFPRGSGVRARRDALIRATEALAKARDGVGTAELETLAQAVKQAIGEP
ncbi:MAG TPA: hypothetical protein PLE19_01175 [Planctomycetota bacterium]|nr:hypothetical protein [Planctomycetota bacterium]HRR79425.1 hypothetical protein [Planctomycetota bacterium]HRT95695.1 hypothetical protein [Planctomycetota bacterium]